jgi:plasmid stability protein
MTDFDPRPREPRGQPATNINLAVLALIACAAALGGCASFRPADTTGTAGQPSTLTVPKPTDVGVYFDMLDRLAPGDPVRQAAEVQSLLTEAQQNPTASNRLRYALALGAAGHASSNPVEARRLISELLAGQNDLQPKEISLANAYLREFDARVALYADLARQREEAEQKLQALNADGDRRYNALNAETQRLKKALAEAERKLEAVAEMEQALTPEGQQP